MLISDSNEFIFIHIPKTAGTSIRSALQPYSLQTPSSRLARILKRFDLPKDYQKFRFNLHATLQKAQSKLPPELYGGYKKIAFVRNPYDRMVSNYAYKVHGTADKNRKRNDSFEEFVLQCCSGKDLIQTDYLTDLKGNLDCDFIGRFESLSEDYSRMQEILGIELTPLAKKNNSKRKGSYHDYYTDKTRDIVAKYYQKDIDNFGYEF